MTMRTVLRRAEPLLNPARDSYLHPLELVEAPIDGFEEDVFSSKPCRSPSWSGCTA